SPGDVDGRLLDLARGGDHLVELVGRDGGDAVERLGQTVAAPEDAAVGSDDGGGACTARDPLVAIAAANIVVAGAAEDRVVARAAVDRRVSGLGVHLARQADVINGCRVERRAAGGVVEQVDGPRDDAHRTAVVRCAGSGVGLVVVELEEGTAVGAVGADQVVDVAVVGDDDAGVVRVPDGVDRVGGRHSVVAADPRAGTGED